MKNSNIPNGDALADEVEVDLDMLRALVLDRVGGEVNRADVVAVDEGAPSEMTVKLLEELPEPARLRHAVGHGAVLRLSARPGDDVLVLRGPEDEVLPEEHRVA